MSVNSAFVVGTCPRCKGSGAYRNTKHFFYAICLIASGVHCFFQWPPTPGLFEAIWSGTARLGLPSWTGSVLMWAATGIPPLFGLAFMYSYFKADTCPACNGRQKATKLAANAAK